MRVERLRAAYEIELKYTHFPLHPETPEQGMTLEQLFAGHNFDIPAANARMTRLMAEEGLPYGNRTMTYNSRLAQELAKWAESQPGGDRIHDALFRAYFVDGLNLAQLDTLLGIAKQLGLSEKEATDIIAARQFKAAVDDDWQRSRELGITGVPTFVMGDRMAIGAQPYENLESLVLEAGGKARN